MCLAWITWSFITSTNMQILYVVQIDMADEGNNPDWANVRAFESNEEALADIEWMKGEYGQDIPFQITMLEFHSKETK